MGCLAEVRSAKDMPKDCSSGHKPDADWKRCTRCGKELKYADGIHVHDPRSHRALDASA